MKIGFQKTLAFKFVIGRGPDNNNDNDNPRRIRGSEKRKTSNERRTHSPALLRRPAIYVVGKIYKKYEVEYVIKHKKEYQNQNQHHFFPQHQVVGLLNSARECVRPSLLVFLFSDPPYPAGVIVIIVIVVIWTPPNNRFEY